MAVEMPDVFDPARAVGEYGRVLAHCDRTVENPEDTLKLIRVCQQLLLAGGVLLDMGAAEIGDALNHYEKNKGHQPGRPKHVVTPMRHGAQLLRVAASRYPVSSKNFREKYMEDMAKTRRGGSRTYSMS